MKVFRIGYILRLRIPGGSRTEDGLEPGSDKPRIETALEHTPEAGWELAVAQRIMNARWKPSPVCAETGWPWQDGFCVPAFFLIGGSLAWVGLVVLFFV